MNREILDRMKEAGEQHDNPVLDAVTQVAEFTVDQNEKTARRVGDVESKITETQKSIVNGDEKIRTEMESGFKMVADKLAAIDKRQSIVGGLGPQIWGKEDKVLSAIPESKRHLVRRASSAINATASDKRKDLGEVQGNPVLRAATGLWYAHTMRLQMRSYAEQHDEIRKELGVINEALQDAYGKAAYSQGTPTTRSEATGGYLVPEIIADDVLRIVIDNGVVVPRARHIPMPSDDMKIPNEATGVTVFWAAEAGNLTGGEGTFGQNVLEAKKLIGRATMSREVMEDAVVSLVPYIQELFGEKFAYELDQEALEGDGTNFTGINGESNVNSVATTTTDGEALTYTDLVQVLFSAGEQSTRVGAGWFMNPKIFATIVGLVDSNGQPIFQYANVPGQVPFQLLGFPCYLTTAASVDITRGSTASTGNIYFGDPRKLVFGDRTAMRFEVSDQVNWATDQIDARMIGRWGFTVGTPAAWTKLVGATLLGA